MTVIAWVLLAGLIALFVLFCFTVWALAERSVALVEIARQPHLSSWTLSEIAREALANTGAKKFKIPRDPRHKFT